MRLKRVVQCGFGALSGCLPLKALVKSFALRHINVVYYHYVGDTNSYYGEFYDGCTVERFRRDLQALRKVFEIVPLAKVIEFNQGMHTPRVPYLAVTFDDGFNLCRKEVLQALDEYKIKATSFVITSCLDNRNLMWRNKLSVIRAAVSEEEFLAKYNDLMTELNYVEITRGDQLRAAAVNWDMSRKDEWADELWKRCGLAPLADYLEEHRPYFTWKGLSDWIAGGHSVGFHTDTHPFCSRLGPEDMGREIFKPAIQLKERFRLSSLPFSYPFGDRLPPECEEELCKQNLFSCAFGVGGFVKRNTPSYRLQREQIEPTGPAWPVFGRSVLRSLKPGAGES